MMQIIFMFVKQNMLEIIATIYLAMVVTWWIAFIANGLGYSKFELGSIWQGIGALSGAGFISSLKYITDSYCNSPQGSMPQISQVNISIKKEGNNNVGN